RSRRRSRRATRQSGRRRRRRWGVRSVGEDGDDEAEFSSPLIDHLPKKTGVPTPKDVLGYHVGAEKKLTYWADQQKWYRALEKALPGRVKTSVIGKTEEGREIMIVYVTSDANLKTTEQKRANM